MKQENWEWVDTDSLKIDGVNPNVLDKKGKDALRKNIEKYGWNMPIITDMDNLIADGEQKWEVAKEAGWKQVPILKKEISDTDRRIIRQSMNKLRGVHNVEMDADEFKKILESTDMEDFTALTGQSEQEILNILNSVEEHATSEDIEQVDKLYGIKITCPKCKFQFEKKDE